MELAEHRYGAHELNGIGYMCFVYPLREGWTSIPAKVCYHCLRRKITNWWI